jgi:hypothetical protein
MCTLYPAQTIGPCYAQNPMIRMDISDGNASDFLFLSGNAKADQVLLSTAKRPDGVLHAWKVLSIG